jgi:hypothetical protein
MTQPCRTSLKALLTLFLGLLSLPMLGFGTYFLTCWFRIHASDVYYVEYSYGIAGLLWVGIGLISLSITLYGIWRRSFYGLLFAIPLFVSLATLVIIPDGRPELFRSMPADSNYLSHLNSSLEVWYEDRHRFPTSESELRDALAKGQAAWQYRLAVPQSRYMLQGKPLPYEFVILKNAIGPRVADASQRPGVIYYSISSDLQEFWVTMTGLQSDVARAAVIKRVADRPEEKYWIVHGAGRDYPVKKR